MIESLENKNIKHLQSLQEKKYRNLHNKFVVEGYHLIEEAHKSGYLKSIFIKEGESIDIPVETYVVSERVFKKISVLETSSIIGICSKLETELTYSDKIIILDGIQDPGNLGTIIRGCKAFNVKTIICSPDTVDLYNPKVIRSTGGIIFDLNIIYVDLTKIINDLKEKDYLIYATDVDAGEDIKNIQKNKVAIIMGNEGNGVRENIKNLAEPINIKTNSEVESLNVAMATTIILYELNRE